MKKEKFTSSLGFRNCNPCNIRYNPKNNWLGQIGHHKGFCKFQTMEMGYRAAMKLLYNYIFKYDCKSIESLITRFAPPSENNTQNYIDYITSYVRIHYKLDISSTHNVLENIIFQLPPKNVNLKDFKNKKIIELLQFLAWSMSCFEMGIQPDDYSIYQESEVNSFPTNFNYCYNSCILASRKFFLELSESKE